MIKNSEQAKLEREEVEKSEKLLSPKRDAVFHSLFRKGNERITKALIQDITQRKYKIINMDKNVILEDGVVDHKNEVLDLLVELDDGELCNVEIQLSNTTNFRERMLEYWAKLYSRQMEIGDKYTELKRTIIIAIVDFNIKDLKNEGYHTKWQIREENNHKLILTKHFELHIIEIEKAKKALGKNKCDKIAQWMSFFDNPNSTEVKSMSEKNEDINEAMKELRRLSSNKELVWRMYMEDRRERDNQAILDFKIEEATKKVVRKAKKETKIATKKALKDGKEQRNKRSCKENARKKHSNW